ncbi:MAG: FoF1 ATP synthase subunit gamma [Chloroflexota bacterium]|nr:FoF1 ATP synthase subunit gamma [Chloroflexota bacterium]
MQSINEIQNRLQGMEDIRHLLRSVRAMSAIRWRRAKKHLEIAQSFATHTDTQLTTMFSAIGSDLPETIAHRGHQKSGQRNVGLITLTSDRGLCGNFNTGLIVEAIHVTHILNRKNKQVKIISLGGYGERLFRNAGYDIFFSEKVPGFQTISYVNIRKVIAHIRAFYETREIDELNILYNQFNYFGSYTPKSVQILPPQFSVIDPKSEHVPDDLIINSDAEALKSFLIWEHLGSRLYLAIIESTISEHSARLQTMDSAISNLDQRMADLEIKFHTIRQEKITQDVLEVQSNLRDRKKRK